MGNRAIIARERDRNSEHAVGVYLHWDGDPNIVRAMLEYARMRGYRSPDDDSGYGWARLCQIACNFNTEAYTSTLEHKTCIRDGLSVGVEIFDIPAEIATAWDNGVYLIEGWSVAAQLGRDGPIDGEWSDEEVLDWVIALDETYPESVRLGEETVRAEFRKDTPEQDRVRRCGEREVAA